MAIKNYLNKKSVIKRTGDARRRAAITLPTPGKNIKRNSPSMTTLLKKPPVSTPAQVTSTRDMLFSQPSSTYKPKSWTQEKVFGKMNAGDFSSIAGRLGSALSPNSPMGRVGAATAGLAEREQKRFAEAPDKALLREWKTAQINRLNNPKPTYDQGYRQLNGKWYKGYNEKGTNKFTPTRPLTDAEIKTNLTGKKAKKTYHYSVDNEGNTSVFENGKLISGTGKGKAIKGPVSKVIDDKGNVSFFQGDKLISGTGKGKTKAAPYNAFQDKVDANMKENPGTSRWDAIVAVASLGKGKDSGLTSTQLSAIKYIKELKDSGTDLDTINLVADKAGLGQFQWTPTGEFEPVEGTGFLGFGQDTKPIMEITPVDRGTVGPSKAGEQQVPGRGETDMPGVNARLSTVIAPDGTKFGYDPKTGKAYDKNGKELSQADIDSYSRSSFENRPMTTNEKAQSAISWAIPKDSNYFSNSWKQLKRDTKNKFYPHGYPWENNYGFGNK